MKLVCTQQDLSNNLSLVSRAVPSRPTHPVLANVKLEAIAHEPLGERSEIEPGDDNGSVRLTGFDLSLGIQSSFSAQVEAEGILTLPAKLLNDIVSKLPSGDLTLESNDNEDLVTITSGSGRYQVRGMSAEEFPELPLIDDGEAKQLPAKALIDGLKGSLVACSQDETKQILTGVYLKVKSDCLEFAATDGHRLSIVEVERGDNEESTDPIAVLFEVTVPAKALRELEKMLSSRQERDCLALHLEQGQVVFDWKNQKLTTRTLEGKYPDYRLLIPRQFQRQVTLDRKQLLGALEIVAVLADQSNLVKFSIDSEHQSLSLSAEAQERGSGEESLTAQISGENLDIAFNVKYLMDGLKTLTSQEITINLNGPLEPVILSPLGGIKMTYLVMPVQLRK
jgi:DNA polymerase-3 subunit beta